MLGAYAAGVPVAPISPAYSTLSTDLAAVHVPVHAHAQRNADQRESEAGEREGNLPVEFHADRLGEVAPLLARRFELLPPLD